MSCKSSNLGGQGRLPSKVSSQDVKDYKELDTEPGEDIREDYPRQTEQCMQGPKS